MTNADSSYTRIWQIVARIPSGRVATYGQIARLAGLGQRARLVGYALHRTPVSVDLPWHRVINAKGMISFAPSHPNFNTQRLRLLREGVEFQGERIDLHRFRWDGGDNDLPLEYLNGK